MSELTLPKWLTNGHSIYLWYEVNFCQLRINLNFIIILKFWNFFPDELDFLPVDFFIVSRQGKTSREKEQEQSWSLFEEKLLAKWSQGQSASTKQFKCWNYYAWVKGFFFVALESYCMSHTYYDWYNWLDKIQ